MSQKYVSTAYIAQSSPHKAVLMKAIDLITYGRSLGKLEPYSASTTCFTSLKKQIAVWEQMLKQTLILAKSKKP